MSAAARILGAFGLRLPVFATGRAGAVPAAGAEPSAAKSLREDGTWSSSGGGGSGDVVGPASSVASEVALFDGNTGKLIKRATGTGLAKLTSGVLSAVTTWAGAGLTGTASRLASFDGTGNPTDTTLAAAMEALSSTQGAVLYRNASAWVALAAGTAGQRLRTGGSGANPAWADLLGFYGAGSDGALTFDGVATVLGMAPAGGVYTITREIFATDLTISASVRLNCRSYGLWVNGTLTGADATSIISANGVDGSGSTPGPADSAVAPYAFSSGAGGAGRTASSGAGSNGTGVGVSPCGSGGSGGAAGGAGGGSAGVSTPSAANRGGSGALDWIWRRCRYFEGATVVSAGGGSGGGGGGLMHTVGSGAGGGGGSGARSVVVFARALAGTGYIEANGGNGATSTAAGGDLGGGGGGGGGGAAILVTSSPSSSWTVRANGGTAGSGAGGGSAGSAGAAGLTLTFIL